MDVDCKLTHHLTAWCLMVGPKVYKASSSKGGGQKRSDSLACA